MTLVIGLLTDQGWPWFPGVDGLDHEDDANQRIEHGYPSHKRQRFRTTYFWRMSRRKTSSVLGY